MIEFVLVAALALLAYTYAGYPALVWMLACCSRRRARGAAYEPHVTVIVVVYNEGARIGRKLDTCIGCDYPAEKLRVLVASDGSDDDTHEIVATYAARAVALLAFPARRGKAACLNDAIAASDGEVVVLTDARQRLDASAIRHLVESLADPAVGAASGELVFEADGMTPFGEGVDAYWRYEKFIRRQESRVHSVVGVTGALYALRRECFRDIPVDTILDDVVIPMNVVMAGKRVVFEGRALAFDVPSRDHQQEKLRKVRTIAGNFQLMAAHPAFFVPFRNPIFVQLVSHKVLRLVSPYCLVLLLLANALLASGGLFYQCLLAAQLLAYALPVIGVLRPSSRRWKVVKVATAFVMLNWFAVLGALEFARNRNAHLWNSRQRAAAGDSRFR